MPVSLPQPGCFRGCADDCTARRVDARPRHWLRCGAVCAPIPQVRL